MTRPLKRKKAKKTRPWDWVPMWIRRCDTSYPWPWSRLQPWPRIDTGRLDRWLTSVGGDYTLRVIAVRRQQRWSMSSEDVVSIDQLRVLVETWNLSAIPYHAKDAPTPEGLDAFDEAVYRRAYMESEGLARVVGRAEATRQWPEILQKARMASHATLHAQLITDVDVRAENARVAKAEKAAAKMKLYESRIRRLAKDADKTVEEIIRDLRDGADPDEDIPDMPSRRAIERLIRLTRKNRR